MSDSNNYEVKTPDALVSPPLSPTSSEPPRGGAPTSSPAYVLSRENSPPEAKQVLTDVPLENVLALGSNVDPLVIDPLVVEFRKQLSLVVDVKHLNAANLLVAVTKGMQLAKDFKTKTNEQKKMLLLQTLAQMIHDSDLAQEKKDDLVWVVDEMGPSAIELFLVVAEKGANAFKKSGLFKCCS